jgi:Bacterial transcription activator, effector binding domain.
MDSFLLGGMSFYGDPFSSKGGWEAENEIGKTFSRFNSYKSKTSDQTFFLPTDRMFELHIYGSETTSRGYFEVFIGEEVTTAQLPIELCSKYISASDYIKVTLSGTEITQDWYYQLEHEIIPSYQAEKKNTYMLQVYDKRFIGMEQLEASEMDVFVPVERKKV